LIWVWLAERGRSSRIYEIVDLGRGFILRQSRKLNETRNFRYNR